MPNPPTSNPLSEGERHLRLTDHQRRYMDAGNALIVHCDICDNEYFVAELPMDMAEMVRVTRSFKCQNDKSHRLMMGPLKS